MPEVIFYNDIFLDKESARKVCLAIEAAARSLGRNESLRFSIVDDVVVIETEAMNTVIETNKDSIRLT